MATGLPPSGAFDSFGARAANLLVGNPAGGRYLVGGSQGAALLEVLLGGLGAVMHQDTVLAVTGAELELNVDGTPVDLWRSIYVERGQRISLGSPQHGARSYVAFAGGISVPKVLGSRSTNVRAGIGGLDGRALRAGDELPLGLPSNPLPRLRGRRFADDCIPPLRGSWRLGVVLGPQSDLFTAASVKTFLTASWRLSTMADRMGCRFVGPALTFNPRPAYQAEQAGADSSNIVDDVTPLGGIQVPSGLEPIVMGPDGPSIGGYAKIATLLSTDLCTLGQIRPGEEVRFRRQTPADGVRQIREREERLVAGAAAFRRQS